MEQVIDVYSKVIKKRCGSESGSAGRVGKSRLCFRPALWLTGEVVEGRERRRRSHASPILALHRPPATREQGEWTTIPSVS